MRKLPGAFERVLKISLKRANSALLRCGKSAAFLLLMILSGIVFSTPIQAQSPQEYQIKAVFLYNFALFVEWPPGTFSDPRAPIVIGILGRDPFGSYLKEAIEGETINDHSLVIARYRTVEEIKQCHILFISDSESEQLETILLALQGRPILTVGEVQGFAQRGGMIRFTNEKNKVRFRINIQSTTAAKLTISSKLLRHADIVSPGKD
ncbi:MAG: YfiR family protein [Acidobacteriota bacterium]